MENGYSKGFRNDVLKGEVLGDLIDSLPRSEVFEGKYVINEQFYDKLMKYNNAGIGVVLYKEENNVLVIRYIRNAVMAADIEKEDGFKRVRIMEFKRLLVFYSYEQIAKAQLMDKEIKEKNSGTMVKMQEVPELIKEENGTESRENVDNIRSKENTDNIQSTGVVENTDNIEKVVNVHGVEDIKAELESLSHSDEGTNTGNTINTKVEVKNDGAGKELSGAVLVNEIIKRTIDDTDRKIKEQREVIERLKKRLDEGFRIVYTGVRMEYTNLKAVQFDIQDPYADGFKYKASSWTQTVEDLAVNGIKVDRLINYTGFTLEEVQLLRFEFTKLAGEIRYKEKCYDLEDDKYNLIINFYDEITELLQEKDNTGSLKYAGDFAFLMIAGKEYLCIKSHRFIKVIYPALKDRILFEDTPKKMIDLLQGAEVLKEMESRKRTVPVSGFFNSCYCIYLKRIKEIRGMTENGLEEVENINE